MWKGQDVEVEPDGRRIWRNPQALLMTAGWTFESAVLTTTCRCQVWGEQNRTLVLKSTSTEGADLGDGSELWTG